MDLISVEKIFDNLNIDYSYPGFYNDSNFVIEESRKSDFLNNYALYVRKKSYSTEYLSKAKSVIHKIVKLFSDEVIKDGKLGRCVDSSLILSLILEKAGFWNYIVQGSVTIKCPDKYGFPPARFFSFDVTKFNAPHVWIVAAPFLIIDTTIKMQPYQKIDTSIFPDFICSDSVIPTVAKDHDIISEESAHQLFKNGYKGDLIEHFMPGYKSFFQDFPALLAMESGIEFKYVPVAFSAPTENLENNTYQINNYSAEELYEKIISELK